MHRSHYTDEVRLETPAPRMPWPVAGVLLAVAIGALAVGLRDTQKRADRYHEAARLTAAAEKAAHPAFARK